MRILRSIAVVSVTAFALIPAPPAAAAPTALAGLGPLAALGRAVLAPSDGWAAEGTGTTGGSAADDAHVFVASTRAELVAALGGDNATNRTNAAPKIVFIKGTVNGFEAADGHQLGCA